MEPSQEDEWKWMVDQQPCSGSATGDSGHATMTATGEDEPINNIEELIGAVGGVNESVTTEHLSDVEWRDDDPLFVFDDDNVTKPQIPVATSTQFEHVKRKTKLFPQLNHPSGKNFAFKSLNC